LTGPLAGIRVLDLATNISGASATMILADLGADVIKVEHPDKGDITREMGPHLGQWGAHFVAANRGKRSLALDVRRPEGCEVILRLAQQSDVLVESFLGWKATSLGFDEKAVRAVRPNIIYVSLSAYGSRGPDHEKHGYDALLPEHQMDLQRVLECRSWTWAAESGQLSESWQACSSVNARERGRR
jgi:crotonobetainyl-CoA:carnitine CoA-transferase CaiB-like acyl-CoA transferase